MLSEPLNEFLGNGFREYKHEVKSGPGLLFRSVSWLIERSGGDRDDCHNIPTDLGLSQVATIEDDKSHLKTFTAEEFIHLKRPMGKLTNDTAAEYERKLLYGLALVLVGIYVYRRNLAQRVSGGRAKVFAAAQLCLIFYSRPTLLLERETLSGIELSGVLGQAVYFSSKVEKDANSAEEALSFDTAANPNEAQVLYVRFEIANGDNILSAKNVFELQERLKTKTQVRRVRIASMRDLSGKESFTRA
jgi:hypothetical protein